MTILPCLVPPVPVYHECHWSFGITDAALPAYMAARGLTAGIVYLLPSGGFAIPIPCDDDKDVHLAVHVVS